MSHSGRRRAAAIAKAAGAPTSTPPVVQPPGQSATLSGLWPNGQQTSTAAATRVDDFATWRGTPVGVVTHFLQDYSWSAYDDATSFPYVYNLINGGRSVEIAMTPFAKGVGASLSLAAGGAYVSHWDTVLNAMAAANLNSAQVIIRFAWEMNANFMNWGVLNTAVSGTDTVKNAADYVTMWRLFKGRADALLPNALLSWCPNNTSSTTGPNAGDCYPGPTYVDIHGVDCYDQWFSQKFPTTGTTTQQQSWWASAWSFQRDSNWGLAQMANFAATNGKPFSLGEWGCILRGDGYGGCDDPSFITNMRTFMYTDVPKLVPQGLHHESYFDYSGSTAYSYLGPLTTNFPNAAAQYITLF